MIGALLRKDWRLLWPLVALVTLVQGGFEWASFRSTEVGADAVAADLAKLFALAWGAGIVALAAAVVQEDPIPGVDQDWLVRPIPRWRLLCAKLMFVVMTISAPMLVFNIAHGMAAGFGWWATAVAALRKELYTLLCLIVPAMALATLGRNLAELVLVAAALVVAFAVGLGASAAVLGADRCPTCDTGMAWWQHLLQHLEVLAGSMFVLGVQYRWRATRTARAFAIGGALVVAVVQLPWSAAFALQQFASPGIPRADAAIVLLDRPSTEGLPDGAPEGRVRPRAPMTRRAAQALLHGDVDSAAEDLGNAAHRSSKFVSVDLPQRITRLAPDESVMVDRAEVSIRTPSGALLYARPNLAQPPGPFSVTPANGADAPDVIAQQIEIPAVAGGLAGDAQLRVDYWMTSLVRIAEYRVPALAGSWRSPALGACRTFRDHNLIRLRCEQIGAAPFCYQATLYAADGRHNPSEGKCTPDYRIDVPDPRQILGFAGIEIPVRDPAGLAHYPVPLEALPTAQLAIEVYAPRAHFRRSLVVPRVEWDR